MSCTLLTWVQTTASYIVLWKSQNVFLSAELGATFDYFKLETPNTHSCTNKLIGAWKNNAVVKMLSLQAADPGLIFDNISGSKKQSKEWSLRWEPGEFLITARPIQSRVPPNRMVVDWGNNSMERLVYHARAPHSISKYHDSLNILMWLI